MIIILLLNWIFPEDEVAKAETKKITFLGVFNFSSEGWKSVLS